MSDQDMIPILIAIVGAATGVAALVLQWRQQNKEAQTKQAELILAAHAQAVQEGGTSSEQLAKISELSVSLLQPLQEQVDSLMARMTTIEGQSQRYRRWIVELVLIVQQYSDKLEGVKLHEMVFTEIVADGTIAALIEAIESPKPGESLNTPGLSGTGRLRVLKKK